MSFSPGNISNPEVRDKLDNILLTLTNDRAFYQSFVSCAKWYIKDGEGEKDLRRLRDRVMVYSEDDKSFLEWSRTRQDRITARVVNHYLEELVTWAIDNGYFLLLEERFPWLKCKQNIADGTYRVEMPRWAGGDTFLFYDSNVVAVPNDFTNQQEEDDMSTEITGRYVRFTNAVIDDEEVGNTPNNAIAGSTGYQAYAPSIETKTFIKGVEAKNLSDEEIFSQIAAIEEEIASLKAIKNQPKKLTDKIADMESSIKDLVAYVDSRD